MAINATQGFDGTEIIDRTVAFVGNTTDGFRSFVAKSLPFAIQRYTRFHPWSFLYKYNLPLAVTQGTNEYDLSVANIGFKMDTDSVTAIYNSTDNLQIPKVDMNKFRSTPSLYNASGDPATAPKVWAEIGSNRILLGPELFTSQTIRIDGYIQTSNFETAAASYDIDSAPDAFDGIYPEIPYEYQEAFVEYVIALALDHEIDDRANVKKALVRDLVAKDIEYDLRRQGDQINLRFKTYQELFDGDY